MGFPYHFLKPEYRHSWPEVLRRELDGHATVEVIDDLPTDVERFAPWDFQDVYVVGNHGYFMLGTEHYDERTGVWVFMYPFSTSVERDGRDMVNLEERIHRVFDSMSLAFTPEAVERYEKSRWTKFYRLFGWEHVGSLDFAHRRKKEIIEGDYDSEPTRNIFDLSPSVRCKPEYQKTWPEIFRQRLEGLATVQLMTAPPRTITSPNGKYSIETPTIVRIDGEDTRYELYGHSSDGVYRIKRFPLSVESIRNHPASRAAFLVFREVTEIELSIFDTDKETEIKKHSIPKNFYGKTRNLWMLTLFFGYLDLVWCIMGVSILCGFMKPLNTYEGNPIYAGAFLTVFGLLFLPLIIHTIYHLFMRQWPIIRLYKEGIQILDLAPAAGNDWSQIFTLKTFHRRTERLRWDEIDSILCGEGSLGIIAIPSAPEAGGDTPMQVFSYDSNSFAIPVGKVGDTIQYFRYHAEARQTLPSW